MKLSLRGQIDPFRVMDTLREANAYAQATGKEILHLSVGQPGTLLPDRVRQKLAQLVLSDHLLGYTDAYGIFPLRERLAQHYAQTYGAHIAPERIALTVGSSAAMAMALLAAFDAGDSIAIALPCYPAYPNMLKALGLKPVFLRATAETHFQPSVEMLAALPQKPAGLIIASPSNPAGTVLSADAMEKLVRYCDAHSIRVLSDEIYHGITYGEVKTASAVALSEHAVTINSFSKYYLMPGWRLGWIVLPEALRRSYDCLLQNFFISAPAIAQYAALEVLECKDELDAVVAEYAKNRALMLEVLPRIGLGNLAPAEGAFYLYANVSELTDDSAAFCREMLEATGVVAVAGYDFDHEQGASYVRFSFAGTHATIREAMRRLEAWLPNRR